ncbi:MAG: glycosyltransferase [Actinomycetota bacterium]|nr:glycosyltransferase [Actinomycetota bacterium]
MTPIPVSATGVGRPLLTIAVPAYNRVAFLRRCLESVLEQGTDDIEVLVSDDSTSDAPGALARALLERSGTRSTYVRNRPSTGMAGNWNACIRMSSGRYVLVLHDDDFLYPGAVSVMKEECERLDWHVGLFDVQIVDEQDRPLRRPRRGGRRRYLPPAEALGRVLSHSSFVRFPGMVVSREAYDSVGPFDERIGPPADLEMWTRLFQRYGLWTLGRRTSAYRVHGEALTSGMWQPAVVAEVDALFSQVARSGLLSGEQIERYRAAWFHRFILAGVVREFRNGNADRAKEILGLFELPELRILPRPVGWRCLRTALSARLALVPERS